MFIFIFLIMASVLFINRSDVYADDSHEALDKTKMTMVVGDTYKLKVYDTYFDWDAYDWYRSEEPIPDESMESYEIKWKSTNKKVATVDKYGNIEAIAPGHATIVCTIGFNEHYCKITVGNLGLSENNMTMQCTEEAALYCFGYKNVKWKSTKPSVVSIDSKGKLKALKKGNATIIADCGEIQYKCKIKVKNAEVLAYNDKKVKLQKLWEVGDTVYATKLLKLLSANKKGSSCTFPNEVSLTAAISYYETITHDYNLKYRNELTENEDGTYTLTITKPKANKKYLKGKSIKYIKQVYDVVKKAGVKDGMDTREAYKKIEKYILDHASYDYSDSHFSYECILATGKAVCEGYSELTLLMCVTSGIECNMQISNRCDHSWNRLKLHNKWYYTDLTFIDTSRNTKYSLTEKVWKDGHHNYVNDVYWFKTNKKGRMQIVIFLH